MDVTGPGTTPTGRPTSAAVRAVLREPDRRPASTTTVPREIVAMIRFLRRNRGRVGADPGGTSATTDPTSAIRARRAEWASGYGRSTPPARTATVSPSAASAPR
jgi:hypothetical protein